MKHTWLLCITCLLFACSANELDESGNTQPHEIRFQAGIATVEVSSRGDGMIQNTLRSDLNVAFVRLNASPDYPDTYAGCTPLSARIQAVDHTLVFSPAQYYPQSGSNTKMLGWYPASGQLNTTDGKVAFPELDGSTDLMVTKVKEGSNTSRMTSCTFYHLLTQISVQAYAVTPSAKEVWGGIESVVIKNKRQTCEVKLPDTHAAAEAEATVTFGNTLSDMPLVTRHIENNTSITGKDNTSVYRTGNSLTLGDATTKAACGYAMFAPHTYTLAGDELVLEVNTEKGGKQTVRIAQSLLTSTSYLVTLKFSDDQISSTADISEWQQGDGIDLGISQPDELAQALAYKEVNDLLQPYTLFHKPADGWVGDPMPFYENGKFHVFYLQDARDGAATFHPWHAATTSNFVTYADNGLMIPCGTADSPEKALGTGSVIKKDGVYYAFYTGHNGDGVVYPRERILLATSTDLRNWTKLPEFKIQADQGYDAAEFRDPVLFFDENSNEYKMLVSTRSNFYSSEWTAVLAQYRSTDLISWTREDPFYNGEGTFMVECPDVFTMNGYQYLIFSDIDDRKVHYKYRATGSGNWTTPAYNALDGVAFYAGKTAGDGNNRYLFGWCPTRVDANDTSNYSWGGSLVVHRLIQQGNGELRIGIPESLNAGINTPVSLTPLLSRNTTLADNTYTLTGGEEKAITIFPRFNTASKLSVTIQPSSAKRFGVELAAYGQQEQIYDLVIDPQAGVIRLDRKINQSVLYTLTSAPLSAPVDGKYQLTLVVENSVCTAYVNNEVALTNRIYTMAGNPWGIFAEEGEAEFTVAMCR